MDAASDDTARPVYEMALIIKRSDYLRRGIEHSVACGMTLSK